MATTQQQLDALNAAIATGAKQVTIDGQTITYRSLGEMQQVARRLEAKINGYNRRPLTGSLSNFLRSQ